MAEVLLDMQQFPDVDAVTPMQLFSLFEDLARLFEAVAAVLQPSPDPASAAAKTQRFAELSKAYFDSLPSSSANPGSSAAELSGKQRLIDVIWTTDQIIEDGPPEEKARASATLASLVQTLHERGVLDTDTLRLQLDLPLLQASGLVAADRRAYWNKTEPRLRASLLYKQQKFNLLREETEGYSKLALELTNNMGPPHDARTARPIELRSDIVARAEQTVLRVKALIGYFDLDPSRALDIILDAFQDNIATHHVFFRELLRASPWGDGARAAKLDDAYTGSYTPAGESSPSRGNVVAQILGFKFAWYSSHDGAGEVPSEKLFLLAALLIWDGFIDLPSLWPHLHPSSDDEMKQLRDDYAEVISERIANAKGNALSMAGVLGDDMPLDHVPAPRSAQNGASVSIMGAASASITVNGGSTVDEAQQSPIKRQPANSRVGLLRALLSIGAIEPAQYILATYSWICDPFPDIAALILRFCNASIEPYYLSASQSAEFARHGGDASKSNDLSQAKMRYSTTDKKVRPTSPPSRWITTKPFDLAKPHNGTWRQPTFFFPEWNTRLPSCQTPDELANILLPMLKVVGVHTGANPQFLARILRIAKAATAPARAYDNTQFAQWSSIIRLHLIPAVALSDPVPALAVEFWELVRNFPYTARFAMYGEWKDRLYKRMPELRVKRAEVERDAKGLLKRLSVDNVKQFGRSLAKIAHTNPLILFDIALNQIQSYDNLITPIVESARYLTPFGYDALAYSLLDALSNPEKDRTKSDGTNVSLWLQGLATFAGTLCKRWNIDVSQILQYILNQLHDGNSKDLIVLRELITRMSGIEPVSDLSDSQVVALGGGRTLQTEALNPTTLVERKGATKRSTARLKAALTDSNLVVPLLVAVALQRQDCIYGDEDAPLKYLGNLFDQSQQILFQYIDFLTYQFSRDEYNSLVPTLHDLWETCGIDATVSFHIVRPVLQAAILKSDPSRLRDMDRLREEARASRQRAEAAKTSTTAIQPDEKPVEEVKVEPALGTATVIDDKADIVQDVTDPTAMVNWSAKSKAIWHPALRESVITAETKLPEAMQLYVTAGFFVTFWQLSLHEILLPISRYEEEIKRLNGLVRETEASLRVPTYPGQVLDRAAETDKRKSLERLVNVIGDLNSDLQANTEVYEATRRRINQEKAHWFKPGNAAAKVKEMSLARKIIVQYFLQECITPRAKLSPVDASFCARFIRILHNHGTPNYPSLHVYDRIFSDELAVIIFHVTEGEARNYARFLHDCLADLSAWFVDESTYNKQAIGGSLPGFQRIWGTRQAGDNIPEGDFLQHKEYRTISKKWHNKMVNAVTACIESADYMCVRNAILILTKIAKFFPFFSDHGATLEGVVAKLVSEEKREDLKVLAMGYAALLKKQSSTWADSATGVVASTNGTNGAVPTVANKSVTIAGKALAAFSPSPSPAPAVAPSATVAPPSSVPHATASATSIPSSAPSPSSTPQSRPSGLPPRPQTEAERRRSEAPIVSAREAAATHAADVRKVPDTVLPTAPRTSHALPSKPSLERQASRREVSSGRVSDSRSDQPRDDAQRASNFSATTGSKNVDSMEVDEPHRIQNTEFVRPSEPNTSRLPAQNRPGISDDSSISKDDRRAPRNGDQDRRRPSRANSVESSNSSHRGRGEHGNTDRDRASRDGRSDRVRERESDRQRETRPDRDMDRQRSGSDRHRDRDRNGPDALRKDREPERASRPDGSRRELERVRPGELPSRTREEDRRDRDKDRDVFKDRDRPRERERDQDRDKNRDRERGDGRERRREDRKIAGVSNQRDDKYDAATVKVTPASVIQHSSAAVGDVSLGSSRELKRSADSAVPIADAPGPTGSANDDRDSKRRRTEDTPPSGPRADRQAAPDASATARPAAGSTSIKGRATARDANAQGLRIRSAASAVSALSSAQQHNARLEASPKLSRTDSQVPLDGDISSPVTPATPAVEDARSRDRPSRETTPRGLADRLAPRGRNDDVGDASTQRQSVQADASRLQNNRDSGSSSRRPQRRRG